MANTAFQNSFLKRKMNEYYTVRRKLALGGT